MREVTRAQAVALMAYVDAMVLGTTEIGRWVNDGPEHQVWDAAARCNRMADKARAALLGLCEEPR